MKILQVSKKFPIPLHDGETIAIMELGRALTELGCDVSLLTMNTSRHRNDSPLEEIDEFKHYKSVYAVPVDNQFKIIDALSNLFSNDSYHISRFECDQFEEKLIDILETSDYDVVQLETLYLAPYVDIIKKHSKALVVMRAHNIEHEIWDRISHQTKFIPKKIYLSYLTKKLKRFEIDKLNSYDFLVAISDRDLIKFKEFGYKNGCISTPVGLSFDNYIPDYQSYDQALKLSFIGSLDWMPNSEGLSWFFDEVWPLITRRFPTCEFHFTGRNAPEALTKLSLKNVFFHPDESDAKAFINNYSIMIVPLLSGSGIRVKILEAMALGKVVITTGVGLEGIKATHAHNVLIANNPDEFINAIQYCFDNQKTIIEIGKNANQFIRNNYDKLQLGQNLITAYQEAVRLHF